MSWLMSNWLVTAAWCMCPRTVWAGSLLSNECHLQLHELDHVKLVGYCGMVYVPPDCVGWKPYVK
eukprot:1160026-Pelagomonas_calceolata.AAC.18